ncbi:hypothetical protein BJX76DRAFT_124385 [Aspergillus varians]
MGGFLWNRSASQERMGSHTEQLGGIRRFLEVHLTEYTDQVVFFSLSLFPEIYPGVFNSPILHYVCTMFYVLLHAPITSAFSVRNGIQIMFSNYVYNIVLCICKPLPRSVEFRP